MERWASNTLRVLGIIVTSIIVVVGSLLLLLLSMCAWTGGGRNQEQALGFMFALVALIAGGILITGKLGKAIATARQSSPEVSLPATASAEPLLRTSSSLPLHLSPLSHRAVKQLAYALAASVTLSTFNAFWNFRRLWTFSGPYGHMAWRALVISYLLYQIPYVLLIAYLMRKPDRRTFAYAFAVPLVVIIQIIYGLASTPAYYRLSVAAPLLTLTSLGMECLILWLAWRASERIGLRHDPPSLLAAGVVAFLYFGILSYAITPWLYRYFYSWR